MASYSELVGVAGAFVRAIAAGRPPAANSGLMERARLLLAEAGRGITRSSPWTPFERRVAIPPGRATIERVAQITGLPADDVEQAMHEHDADMEIWANSRYQVLVHRTHNPVWLSIKRIDQEVIHSWRDLQRIKNELIGPEFDALEIYPAEDKLVDQANQYHLWVFTDGRRLPFGFQHREVRGPSGIGEMQAEFEP